MLSKLKLAFYFMLVLPHWAAAFISDFRRAKETVRQRGIARQEARQEFDRMRKEFEKKFKSDE